MASQSLYRKYRPEHFSELVGQDHVTEHAAATRCARIAPATRISSPAHAAPARPPPRAHPRPQRSTAWTWAPTASPAASVRTAKRCAAGTFFDLVELDAASNNGVDAHPRPHPERASRRRSDQPAQGLHHRRGAHALGGGVEHVAEDAGGAARARRVRARHHRPAEGAADDPVAHAALRVHLLSHDEMVGHLADILAREGVEVDERDPRPDRAARRRLGARRACRCSIRRSRWAAASSTTRRCTRRWAGCRSSSGWRCSTRPRTKTSPVRWRVCTR